MECSEQQHYHCPNADCERFGTLWELRLFMNEVVGAKNIPGVKLG